MVQLSRCWANAHSIHLSISPLEAVLGQCLQRPHGDLDRNVCKYGTVLVLQLKSEWKNTFGGSSDPEPLPAEYDPRNDESYDKVPLCGRPPVLRQSLPWHDQPPVERSVISSAPVVSHSFSQSDMVKTRTNEMACYLCAVCCCLPSSRQSGYVQTSAFVSVV